MLFGVSLALWFVTLECLTAWSKSTSDSTYKSIKTCLECVKKGHIWSGRPENLMCADKCIVSDSPCTSDADGCAAIEEELRAATFKTCEECLDEGYLWTIGKYGSAFCAAGNKCRDGTYKFPVAACPKTKKDCDIDVTTCLGCVKGGGTWSEDEKICDLNYCPSDMNCADDPNGCKAFGEGQANAIDTCKECLDAGYTWKRFAFEEMCTLSDGCKPPSDDAILVCPPKKKYCKPPEDATTCEECVKGYGLWSDVCFSYCLFDSECYSDLQGCADYKEEMHARAITTCKECLGEGYVWNVYTEIDQSLCRSKDCGPPPSYNAYPGVTATCPKSCESKVPMSVKDFGCKKKASDYVPIKIALCDDDNHVTFSLTQVWDMKKVKLISVEYTNMQGMKKCSKYKGIMSGHSFSKNKKAKCVNGKARIILWIRDSAFSASSAPGYSPDSSCNLKSFDCVYEYKVDCKN